MKVSGTVLGKATLICGFVSLAFSEGAAAQASDPFATIFGDAPRAISGSKAGAHEDNIRLVGVQLRQHDLIDVISAYAIPNDLCVETVPILEALKLPLEINNDRLTGWGQTQDRIVDIDLTSGDANIFGTIKNIKSEVQKTPQGWCVSLSALSDITEIDFTYEPSTLMVRANPRKTLPIEAKLERAQIRKSLLSSPEITRPDYAVIDTPYRWLSFPAADVRLDMSAASKSDLSTKLSVELAGDFLQTTARLRSVENNGQQDLRLTLGRVSEAADQLGPLRARQFSLGDITAPALPLSVKSKAGRGGFISNLAAQRATLFDTTQIVGALPQGWEAELYQDERLISFTDQADENGNYVFDDVPLLLGYNRLVVKLFGPYGEQDERVISQFVGGAQCPENELRYTFGVIAPHQSQNTQEGLEKALNGGIEQEESRDEAYALASIEYGLSKRLSTRIDATQFVQTGDYNAAVSVLGSFKSMHGGLRIAADQTGAQAYEAFLQSRLSQRSSLSARWTEYGQLESEYSGNGPSRLKRYGKARLDSQFSARGYVLPVQAILNWSERANGETTLSAQTVTASNFKGVNWSHNLRYAQSKTASGSRQSQMDGGLIASKSLKGFRMRAGLAYTLNDGFDVSALSASVQKSFKKRGVFQASSTYDMTAKTGGVEASFSKAFRNMTASSRIGGNQDGDWQVGVSLAFSLYKPKGKALYTMGAPGLSRSGAVRLLSFEDIDNDGRFGAGDMAVEGAKYIIDNSLRSETSDASGVSLISAIDVYKSTDVELQLSSLDDPFLRPMRSGNALTLRPGQVVDIPVALVTTGDIDGSVMLEKGGHKTPLAGVAIEIVDSNGTVLETSVSEYDGYFYVDNIPAISVTARIAAQDLKTVGGQSKPQDLNLTREKPTVSDVNLIITQ